MELGAILHLPISNCESGTQGKEVISLISVTLHGSVLVNNTVLIMYDKIKGGKYEKI